jgi:hypothetical protein
MSPLAVFLVRTYYTFAELKVGGGGVCKLHLILLALFVLPSISCSQPQAVDSAALHIHTGGIPVL